MIVCLAVGFAPAAQPCCCCSDFEGAGAAGVSRECCQKGVAKPLPPCCQARAASHSQRHDPSPTATPDQSACPPLGCQCGPAKPVADRDSSEVRPVQLWSSLALAPAALLLLLPAVARYEGPRIAINGNRLRSLLCVWRN
jgi:hypothetical protein